MSDNLDHRHDGEAETIVGLAITAAILAVLRSTGRDSHRRLMDAVEPPLVDQVTCQAASLASVQGVEAVRVRWIGHELHAELNVTVDADLSVSPGHDIVEAVHHRLPHEIRRLTAATVHVDAYSHGGTEPHHATAHHRVTPTETTTASYAAGDSLPRSS